MIVTPSEFSGGDDQDISFKRWVDMKFKMTDRQKSVYLF